MGILLSDARPVAACQRRCRARAMSTCRCRGQGVRCVGSGVQVCAADQQTLHDAFHSFELNWYALHRAAMSAGIAMFNIARSLRPWGFANPRASRPDPSGPAPAPPARLRTRFVTIRHNASTGAQSQANPMVVRSGLGSKLAGRSSV